MDRSFGNKTSWDRSFNDWFRVFVDEANQAVFDNGRRNTTVNFDATLVPGSYDLVYVDTPYISRRRVPVDYLDFYHFLEGLSMYDQWEKHIDYNSKHHRLIRQENDWTDEGSILKAFDHLFARFQNSIIVVSYRSDGIPPERELTDLLKQYKRSVRAEHYGKYKYVLSTNSESKEILLIGT